MADWNKVGLYAVFCTCVTCVLTCWYLVGSPRTHYTEKPDRYLYDRLTALEVEVQEQKKIVNALRDLKIQELVEEANELLERKNNGDNLEYNKTYGNGKLRGVGLDIIESSL